MENNGFTTPLHSWHIHHGARMMQFHDWLMPLQYTGIKAEHKAVRQACGLFDVSHMGEIRLRGKDAGALADRVLTKKAGGLKLLQIAYSPMCRQDGGIIDDLLVCRMDQEDFLLIVNAANRQKDVRWLAEQARGRFDALVEDESDSWSLLALQGPLSEAVMKQAGFAPLPEKPFTATRGTCEERACLISRTGYTGEQGFEICCAAGQALDLWEILMRAGERHGLLAAGLGARDTLRLEAGLPLYGNELNESRTPLETRLERFIDWQKPDFVGREALARQKDAGVRRRIIGLTLLDRGVPRSGCPVVGHGEVVGEVTSGTYAPWLDKPIALAFVEQKAAHEGELLSIRIRGRDHRAKVCALPFYKREDP